MSIICDECDKHICIEHPERCNPNMTVAEKLEAIAKTDSEIKNICQKEMSQEETLDWLCRLRSSLDILRVPQEWLSPIKEALGTAIKSVKISDELNKFMRGLWEEHCIEDIEYTSGEFFDTITQEVYEEAEKRA